MAWAPSGAAAETFEISQTSPWGAETARRYHVFVPDGLAADELAPAVLLLHDVGEPAATAAARHGWLETAKQARFAILAPEAGLQASDRIEGGYFNARLWNAGAATAAPWDDAGFLAAVAKDAATRLPVDPSRIYVVGFGEGGAMAQRLAQPGSPGFAAAVASVAGAVYGDVAPGASVPLYLLYGDSDPTNPVAGGAVYTPWAGLSDRPALRDGAEAWRQALDCRGAAAVTADPPGVLREDWRDCGHGGALSIIWVSGLGRQWPGTGRGPAPARVTGPANDVIFAPWDIWRFLESRRR